MDASEIPAALLVAMWALRKPDLTGYIQGAFGLV